MTAIPDLTDEEKYLVSILQDPSGIEFAEFAKLDPTSKDGCYRVWDFQYNLYRNKEMYQIDWCSRAIGKTAGIVMRMTRVRVFLPRSGGANFGPLPEPLTAHL